MPLMPAFTGLRQTAYLPACPRRLSTFMRTQWQKLPASQDHLHLESRPSLRIQSPQFGSLKARCIIGYYPEAARSPAVCFSRCGSWPKPEMRIRQQGPAAHASWLQWGTALIVDSITNRSRKSGRSHQHGFADDDILLSCDAVAYGKYSGTASTLSPSSKGSSQPRLIFTSRS